MRRGTILSNPNLTGLEAFSISYRKEFQLLSCMDIPEDELETLL